MTVHIRLLQDVFDFKKKNMYVLYQFCSFFFVLFSFSTGIHVPCVLKLKGNESPSFSILSTEFGLCALFWICTCASHFTLKAYYVAFHIYYMKSYAKQHYLVSEVISLEKTFLFSGRLTLKYLRTNVYKTLLKIIWCIVLARGPSTSPLDSLCINIWAPKYCKIYIEICSKIHYVDGQSGQIYVHFIMIF